MIFSQWQPAYAERNIPTFPCHGDKKPAVKNYQQFGLPGSKQLIGRFASAEALGFMCGKRTGVTVLDVDATDERVLADAIDRHGTTPIVVRTASKKFQAWYRHSNERRRIRAWNGLPIDLLGGGYVVAPASQINRGQYEFIQGRLDDISKLPVLQGLEADLYQRAIDKRPANWANMRNGDGRNKAMFELLARTVRAVDDFEQLLDYARTQNEQLGEPMPDMEVVSTANSAWKMQCEGRNRFGTFGTWSPLDEVKSFAGDQDAFYLLSFLRANQGPNATFMVANGLAEIFGWHRRRVAQARSKLIEQGYFRPVRQAGRGHPALFHWTNPARLSAPNTTRPAGAVYR